MSSNNIAGDNSDHDPIHNADDSDDYDDEDDNDDNVADCRRTWQKMAFLAAAEVITGAFVFLTPWVGIQPLLSLLAPSETLNIMVIFMICIMMRHFFGFYSAKRHSSITVTG